MHSCLLKIDYLERTDLKQLLPPYCELLSFRSDRTYFKHKLTPHILVSALQCCAYCISIGVLIDLIFIFPNPLLVRTNPKCQQEQRKNHTHLCSKHECLLAFSIHCQPFLQPVATSRLEDAHHMMLLLIVLLSQLHACLWYVLYHSLYMSCFIYPSSSHAQRQENCCKVL